MFGFKGGRSHQATHRLRFTGRCDEAEFKARCARQAHWYHSFYFDNGFTQRGDYDIGRDIAAYGFPADMTGMSVLDVGTGSGWFATYFEQCGAAVTAIDVRGYCDLDMFGRPGYPDILTEKPAPDRLLPDGRPVYFSPVSQGLWIMKDILGLKAEYVNARIYDLRPELFGGQAFDLVFLGAVLMHVRDPIGALMAARSVSRDRLIATSLREDADGAPPRMTLAASDRDFFSWWVPSAACLYRWFEAAGFARVEAERSVPLHTDQPYRGPGDSSTAASQTLCLVDAHV